MLRHRRRFYGSSHRRQEPSSMVSCFQASSGRKDETLNDFYASVSGLYGFRDVHRDSSHCPTLTRTLAPVSWMASLIESPSLFTQGPPGLPGATGEKVLFPLKGPSEWSIHDSVTADNMETSRSVLRRQTEPPEPDCPLETDSVH